MRRILEPHSLTISDTCAPLRIDGLLLDPDHPQTSDANSPMEWLQTTHAECLAQLAVHAESREALLANPAVSEALQAVVENAMGEEARLHASAALMPLGDQHPDSSSDGSFEGQKYVMLSYQWCVVPSAALSWHGC